MPKSSLSYAFFNIVLAINKFAYSVIKWPTPQEMASSKTVFQRRCGLQNIIGAIDGTYVAIKAPKEMNRAYTNRKCFTAITLQAVCNENMKYIDCFVGFPSSAHDARIFRNSHLYIDVQADVNSFFPNNEVIIADKAYPRLPWVLPPYIESSRRPLTDEQKIFNKAQASAREVVERSFAHLFGRWRRLKYIDMNVIDFIPDTILAACVLHNICIDYHDRVNQFVDEGLEAAARCRTDGDHNELEY